MIQIKKNWLGKAYVKVDLKELLSFEPIKQNLEKTKYKLIKDLPFLKAGTILEFHEDHYGMVTTEPKKFLRDFELHYLESFMDEVHESPSEYRDFIKLLTFK